LNTLKGIDKMSVFCVFEIYGQGDSGDEYHLRAIFQDMVSAQLFVDENEDNSYCIEEWEAK
jgi:hypothetical protein